MPEYSLPIRYSLPIAQSVPDVSPWVVMEQAEIPLDQSIASKSDVYSMLNMASLGQSARSYRSGRCPVTRSYGADSVTARTKVSFYVHHSEGLRYNVVPSEGVLDKYPIIVLRRKNEIIKTEYREQFQLGWLPLKGSFSSSFATDCYDKKRKLVLPRPDVVQDNGFVYVKGAVWSALKVSGLSVSDRWTLTIEHQQGERFARSISVEVVWFEAVEQKSERLELKLPGCVVDEFNKCPYEDDPEYWNIRINYSSAHIVYSDCDGGVLKIYEDEEI